MASPLDRRLNPTKIQSDTRAQQHSPMRLPPSPRLLDAGENWPGLSSSLPNRPGSNNAANRMFTEVDSLLNAQPILEERERPGPNVPEPMVFDLIRPWGVRQGELEVNVLGFVPMRRTRSRNPLFSFISGADQVGRKRPSIEWAPEIEYGVVDNLAVEFELPMADGHVEAFKGAVQYTLGTAFEDRFIHGLQGILFVDRTNGAITPTLLYLAALRIDPVYSVQMMLGFNHEFGGDNELSPSQLLLNSTLFAEVTERWTYGLEMNYASDMFGNASLLFMPQAHFNPSEKTSVQFGVGTRAQGGNTVAEFVFRVVRSF